MICLSRGIGSGSLADLLFLTWPWYCSTSRRCGCLRTPSLKKKKKSEEKYFFFARAKNFKLSCSPVAVLSASRAPLAERSAVNRQVLGSIPSGGVRLFFKFFRGLHTGVSQLHRDIVIRSYQGESTASHPNCEVKHPWA